MPVEQFNVQIARASARAFPETGAAEPAQDRERAIEPAVALDRGGRPTGFAAAADQWVGRARGFDSLEYAFSVGR